MLTNQKMLNWKIMTQQDVAYQCFEYDVRSL